LGLLVALLAYGAEPRHPLRALSAEQAQKLETRLKSNPDDLDARVNLMSYYVLSNAHTHVAGQTPSRESMDALRGHVLWFIEHHPDDEEAADLMPMALRIDDPAGHAQARAQWQVQVDKQRDNAHVLTNAAYFSAIDDHRLSTELLERALDLSPEYARAANLLAQQYELQARIGRKHKEDKQQIEKRAFALRERASAALNSEERFYSLQDLARTAFEAGEFVKAQLYAQELVDSAARYSGNWNYGNAAHHGNIVLGRIALQDGDVQRARQHLLAAATMSGSPQLNSFGPNMTLAKELLGRGERQIVLKYFEMCAKFWVSGSSKLEEWAATVKGGGLPDFGALAY
jgi:tetratricopeptide (TPR) repeat protein